MKLEKALSDVYESGEEVSRCVNDILLSERYCAACEVYRVYLQQNREKAELYYHQFKAQNDKVFKQAMDVFDLAIEFHNVQLAEAAAMLVKTMKEAYPNFYAAYFKQLFGN